MIISFKTDELNMVKILSFINYMYMKIIACKDYTILVCTKLSEENNYQMSSYFAHFQRRFAKIVHKYEFEG